MKNPLLVALLALAVSGLCLVVLLTNPLETGVREAAAGASTAHDSQADVLERIGELAEAQRQLRERLERLEVRPAPALRAPAEASAVSREEFEAFRDELLGALDEAPGPDDPRRGEALSPAEIDDFRAHVAEAITEIRKQETADKLRAVEQRAERLEVVLPMWAQRLDLSPDQTGRLRAALLARYDREADVLRRWEAGAPPEVLGELKRNDREVHRLELAEFLTPEQLAAFPSLLGGSSK